jgi:hypothetical protein
MREPDGLLQRVEQRRSTIADMAFVECELRNDPAAAADEDSLLNLLHKAMLAQAVDATR